MRVWHLRGASPRRCHRSLRASHRCLRRTDAGLISQSRIPDREPSIPSPMSSIPGRTAPGT